MTSEIGMTGTWMMGTAFRRYLRVLSARKIGNTMTHCTAVCNTTGPLIIGFTRSNPGQPVRIYMSRNVTGNTMKLVICARGLSLRECLKTSQNSVGRANLRDDQIQSSLPDRSE